MTVEKFRLVVEIVASALNVPLESLSQDSSMQNVPQWDSLAQLTICLTLEERFHFKMDMDTIATATSLGQLVACLP
jgi:acyl carrier protein